MQPALRLVQTTPPLIQRMSALGANSASAVGALSAASNRSRVLPTRRELLSEGKPIADPLLVIAGWAARVRILPDGRRQFLSFLFPGDLIGMCRQQSPLAVSTVVALTEVQFCAAPSDRGLPDLSAAYGMSHALDEAYLLAQVTRLGRLSAQERIADLLLEFHERLALAGLAINGGFDIPLTQEVLADSLGLTSVHVNRMLQQARRDGDLVWHGGHVRLSDPQHLAEQIGRIRPRVSAIEPFVS